ncbi:MAG: MerR family transcriptional regulator [Acidobacteriaceae bacterium]|nr:MerR family transcriptional regulator [Acidobacteriaceae bacterium]
MLKIGDFSALTQVSVKTLRFYDEAGLLHPAHVDAQSGYRYYAAGQLKRLHRILALKDLGFSLEQIRQLLEEGVTPEQLRGMLLLRRADQENRVRDEQDRLNRLQLRLRLIEKENLMSQDIIVKELSPQWIASVRKTIPSYPAVGQLYGEIFAALGPHAAGAGPVVALWHDPEYKEKDVDAEAGVYLKTSVPVNDSVRVYELPAVKAASIIHQGAYNRLSESYDAILRWIEANRTSVAGPIRELYLQCGNPVRQDDESYVTEIQIPISQAS